MQHEKILPFPWGTRAQAVDVKVALHYRAAGLDSRMEFHWREPLTGIGTAAHRLVLYAGYPFSLGNASYEAYQHCPPSCAGTCALCIVTALAQCQNVLILTIAYLLKGMELGGLEVGHPHFVVTWTDEGGQVVGSSLGHLVGLEVRHPCTVVTWRWPGGGSSVA